MKKTLGAVVDTAIAKRPEVSLERYIPIGSNDVGALLQSAKENLGEGETIGPWDLFKIKIPAGGSILWEIANIDTPEEPETLKSIQGIVVYNVLTRSFWEGEFSGAGTPPDCFSPDAHFGNGDPKDGKGSRANIPCADCPNSVFGSAPRGTGQACRQIRLIFLLLEDSFLPALVGVTPGSLRRFKKFLMDLTMRGRSIGDNVIGLSLEKAQSSAGITYSRIVPSIVGEIPLEHREKIQSYIEMIRPMLGSLGTSGLREMARDFASTETGE